MTSTRTLPTLLATSALALALGLVGCGNMSQRDWATATGASVGALGGAVLGGGTVGTLGGAAVGAVIGNQIGKDDK